MLLKCTILSSDVLSLADQCQKHCNGNSAQCSIGNSVERSGNAETSRNSSAALGFSPQKAYADLTVLSLAEG